MPDRIGCSMMQQNDVQHIAQLYADFYALEWFLSAGIDELYAQDPINRMAAVDAASMLAEQPLQTVESVKIAVHAPQTPPLAAVAQARTLADAALSVEALQSALQQFDGCVLKRTASHTIVGDGNIAQPRILFIGDTPRDAEDREGLAFAGDAEMIMRKCCKGMGVTWDDCFRLPSVFWRPPGNRMVSKDEMDICIPFVEKFIALLQPAHLVLLGATPVKMLLGVDGAISRMRGKDYEYSNVYCAGDAFKPIVSYHPNMLMGGAAKKKQFWQDMLSITI